MRSVNVLYGHDNKSLMAQYLKNDRRDVDFVNRIFYKHQSNTCGNFEYVTNVHKKNGFNFTLQKQQINQPTNIYSVKTVLTLNMSIFLLKLNHLSLNYFYKLIVQTALKNLS